MADLIKAQVMPEIIPDDNSTVVALAAPAITPTDDHYLQAFSPDNPDIKSLNDGFQKTVNASVSQKDWTPYMPIQYVTTQPEFPVEYKFLIAAGLLITLLILGR